MNECTILKILTSVKKFFSFMLTPKNQKSIELLKLTAVFVRMCTIPEHGGFLQSRSHLFKHFFEIFKKNYHL